MLIRRKAFLSKFFSLAIYSIVFLFSIYPPGDKDWGLHYRYGEIFVHSGTILRHDIFSSTMPGYAWVNHSWAYDPLVYLITQFTGFTGLGIVGAIIFTLTYVVITRSCRLAWWKIALLSIPYMALGETAIMFGLRSQVISLLFLALTIHIVVSGEKNRNILFFLPLVILIWTNIHGDYIVGLGVSACLMTFSIIREFILTKTLPRQKMKWYGTLFGVSCIITFINPFGYQTYIEFWNHLDNPFKMNIYEWMPIYINCSYCHTTFFSLFSIVIFALILKRKKIDDIPYGLILLIFLIPTIQVRRMMPVYGVIGIYYVARVLKHVHWDIQKFKSSMYLAALCFVLTIEYGVFYRIPHYKLLQFSEKDYCSFASNCSVSSVEYLRQNPPQGLGFNFYDWGGYYIGKGIPAKLFIDGRMSTWKKGSYSPFQDYLDINYYGDIDKFNKYHFSWVLIPQESSLTPYLQSASMSAKWRLKFQDGITTYYVKL